MQRSLTLQWHITNRCNKRCKHCYQEEYECNEFTTKELLNIGKQYLELLDEYNKIYNINCRGHVNITGGEPFIRKDIFEILDFFKANKERFTFGILTNGTYLTEDIVKKLKTYNPRIVQVSLDGNKKIHDEIRGAGSYNEVISALKLLNKYNIKGLVSFTANNKNYKYFSDVVRASIKAKAYKVWSDRLVPIGNGQSEEIETLNPEELKKYLSIMKKEKERFINKIFKTKVSMERSLQFLNGCGDIYSCSAGDGLVIITENGDVMPCRRLPIIAGNIKNESLKNIYFNSKVMKEVRKNIIPKGCEKCGFNDTCRGGAKCISYGIYKDYTVGDYGCPLKK